MFTDNQIEYIKAFETSKKVELLLILAMDLDLIDNKGYSAKHNIPLRTVNWQIETLKLPTLAICNKIFIIDKK